MSANKMRIKVTFGNDTRLWRASEIPPKFAQLEAFVLQQWGSVLPDKADRVIQYKDDEGDLISITCQQDLNDAVELCVELGCKSLKLIMTAADRPQGTQYAGSRYAGSVGSASLVGPFKNEQMLQAARLQSLGASAAAASVETKPTEISEEEPPAKRAKITVELDCPKKCGLQMFQAPHGRFRCDNCKASVPLGSTLFGCRSCDFDVCASCAAKESVKLSETRVDDDAKADVEMDPEKKPETKKPPCPWKVHAQDFLKQANTEGSAIHKELDTAVHILFQSQGEEVQTAVDMILASCDAIREHPLIKMARPFLYGYTEKLQRMLPLIHSLGPEVVKKNKTMIFKGLHEMMNNKGDVLLDMAPAMRLMFPGVMKAIEAQMKNGSECTINFEDLFSFGGASTEEAPKAVELTDTDGDKIRFAIEDGKLVEYCNGKLEIPQVHWIKVDEFKGVIKDQGGSFVVAEEQREEKLRQLNQLCQHADVAYHLVGEARFHHGRRHGRRHGRHGHGHHGHKRRWFKRFCEQNGLDMPPRGRGHGCHGRLPGRGMGGRGRHGHWKRCHWGQRAHRGGQHFGNMMKGFAEKMAEKAPQFAKWGEEFAKQFTPKHCQRQKPEYSSKFLSHGNIPQHSTYLPKQILLKEWKLKNTGTKSWADCELIFVKGDSQLLMQDTQRFAVAACEPGEETNVTAMINTPEKPGRYKAVFRMQKLGVNMSANGQRFGGQLFIDIHIVATQEELQAAVLKESIRQAEMDKLRRAQEKKRAAQQEVKEARAKVRVQKKALRAEKIEYRISKVDEKLQNLKLSPKQKPRKENKLEAKRAELMAKLAAIDAELAEAGHERSPSPQPTAGKAQIAEKVTIADEDSDDDMFVDPQDDPLNAEAMMAGDDDDDRKDAGEEKSREEADDEEKPLLPVDAEAEVEPAAEAEGAAANSDSLVDADGFQVISMEEAHAAAEKAQAYKYQEQLAALMGMGFGDVQMCKFALDANNGDIERSVQTILQQMGHSA